MTELPPRADRRHGYRTPQAVGRLQDLHLRLGVIPAVAMALLGAVGITFLLAGRPTTGTARLALACAAAGAVAVLVVTVYAATAATRRVYRQLAALRALAARARDEIQRLEERIQRGERPVPRALEPPPAGKPDPFTLLAYDMRWQQWAAEQAVLRAAGLGNAAERDQRVEVFVNLAWRMQSLVHREIQLLDDLEAQVEDPELLKGLFTVDHLATRMRRQSESLAVLGGATSRRQWSRPVSLHEVLRAAVAEVEQYSRVKVVPPVEGVLQSPAVADVIHLLAELVENATKFSAPHTHVLLRAQSVTAGLAIEVEDRGLGMLAADRHRMNGLLADPGLVNISELLRDGRIGLYVVSALARRHHVRVQLQSNIFGGTQAIVLLPAALVTGQLEPASHDSEPGPLPAASVPASLPRAASSVPVGAAGEPAPSGGRLPAGVAAPASEDRPPSLAGGGQQGRPPLPKRQPQTHLAPQLRETRADRGDDPPIGQIPDLMAAFQGGLRRAEEEGSPGGD